MLIIIVRSTRMLLRIEKSNAILMYYYRLSSLRYRLNPYSIIKESTKKKIGHRCSYLYLWMKYSYSNLNSDLTKFTMYS